ncbi:SpoIIE family protein phosphatase [Desulfitobacterium hafniense]|uniref:SpoIIE family protein phosphatase n=2 Tax=Desulfitobacterium hafniense TaxID=49338 RepID=UPI0003667BB3|nr:SpoIIE family protein phosphatase [Desulfitobacterium hafniense]
MESNFELVKITKTITDMLDDHILVCNTEGKIVFANRMMQARLGYQEAELEHKSFWDIVEDRHGDKAKAFMASAAEPSGWERFLLKGKQGVVSLHLKFLLKEEYIYIYGNEKYIEYERIRKKLDVEIANAVKIHKRTLPERLPDTEQISFASLYIPAEELGGDIFDAFRVDHGLLNDYFEQYVCYIADVSGHGLDSAMLAIFVKDTINSFFRLKHIPGQMLSPQEIVDFFVEHYLEEGYPEEYLVCLFMVVFDLKTKELTYCNAGFHICPLLIKDEEHIIELNNGGLPVSTGIHPDLLKYGDSCHHLSPNMTLFIMSDGLPEQQSENGLYQERLKKLITEIYCLKPAQIVEEIHKDFTSFLSYEKIRDDITLVAVKLS